MNIHEALKKARQENKAIKEDRWEGTCLYHGMDNILRWYKGEGNPYGDNGRECPLSIALLLSERWEVTEMSTYNRCHPSAFV